MVEVMIALLVLGLAVAGMYRVAIMANRTSSQARNHYLAVNIAKNRLEQIKARDFSQIGRFVDSAVVVDMSGQPSLDGEFQRTTSVSNVGTGRVEVVVTVGIRDRATGSFLGESEFVSTQLTEFQDKPR